MKKTLCFTDSHITDSSIYELDNLVFPEILSHSKDVDKIICLGDYYNKARISPTELSFGTKWAKEFSVKEFIMLEGNHPSISDTISSVNYLQYLNIKVAEDYVDNKIFYGHFMTEESEKTGRLHLKEATEVFSKYEKYVKDVEQYEIALLGHCVSSDTEILTKDGWKIYYELKEGEFVATYNMEKNLIEYQEIKHVHKYNYKGDLLNFIHHKNRKLDILCTSNHKMVIQNKSFHHSPILKCAYQVKNDNIILNCPNWNYPILYEFLNKEYAKLIGWIIGDGSLIKNSLGEIYGVRIHQKKGYKSKLIEKLLKRCRITYKKHNPTYVNMNCYYINKDNRILIDFLNLYMSNKKLNRLIISLPQNQLLLLFEGLILSDGYKSEKNNYQFYQKDLQTILLFEELCLRLGKKFVTVKSNSGFKPDSINYCVQVSNQLTAKITNTYNQIKKIPYEGVVWCPEVQNGTWIAKRNGIAFITGNSHSYQKIRDNIYHLGSCRFCSFGESQDPAKYIAIIEHSSKQSSLKFIPLKSVIGMKDVYNVSDLDDIPIRTKVRIIFKSFSQFKKEINQLEEYKNKFYEFKIKLDFTNNTQSIKKEEDVFIKINEWLDNLEDNDIKTILKEEFKLHEK